MIIGLPRALLYYRYGTLWKEFFDSLGVQTAVSPKTNAKILEIGSTKSVDETCLSAKIYMGHVESLLDKCDYILIPRVTGFGVRRTMCTRCQSLYDLVRNVFSEKKDKFLAFDIDEHAGMDEFKTLSEIGCKLGFDKKKVKKAYSEAVKKDKEQWKKQLKKQDALVRQPGSKILVVGHSYVLEDDYLGKRIFDYMKEQGVVTIRADILNREDARKKSAEISPTLKWEINRELIGGIEKYKNMVDGILLVSVYPCGPDSLTNEMIVREYNKLPILSLILDEQDGIAGMETRMESFLDIINFRKELE